MHWNEVFNPITLSACAVGLVFGFLLGMLVMNAIIYFRLKR